MHPSRLKRIIRLLGLLQGGRPHNADSLADACGVTRRTIFRDLDLLRAADVPVELDDVRKVYSIPSQYFFAPNQFCLEEAAAVTLLCHAARSARRTTPPRSYRVSAWH